MLLSPVRPGRSGKSAFSLFTGARLQQEVVPGRQPPLAAPRAGGCFTARNSGRGVSLKGLDGEVSARKTGRSISADRVAAVGVDLELVVPAISCHWRPAASGRAELHRDHSGASGDQEGARAPGFGTAGAAQSTGERAGAASHRLSSTCRQIHAATGRQDWLGITSLDSVGRRVGAILSESR
jgi:hypothetical protein